MKNLFLVSLVMVAMAKLAQASIEGGGQFQCGTVKLQIASDGKAGLVTEKDQLSAFIECENVIDQPGWDPGTVLTCHGEGIGTLPDGSCSPVYLVYTFANGTVNITKDTISCHSCADYEPVYTGTCK